MSKEITNINTLFDLEVTGKLSSLKISAEKLGKKSHNNSVVTGISLLGTLACGIGYLVSPPASYNELLAPSVALGLTCAITILNQLSINNKQRVLDKKISNIEEIQLSDYFKTMQSKDKNFDDYASLIKEIENINLER